MAYFISPASKLERAMRALFILQGKANWENAFIANESRPKVFPSRTFVVTSFMPTRPYRPEGVCQAQIQHHFPAVAQPDQQIIQPRIDEDTMLGDSFDTLNLGGQSEATDLKALADAITQSGRWLAVPDPNDTTGDAARIVAANQDMVNFRCDWVKFGTPMLTRGNDLSSTNWVEILHLSAFVSHANAALPN